MNVIHLIVCTNCDEQHEGSTIDFKEHFRIYKSDISTKIDRYGVCDHLTNKCWDPHNLHVFLKIRAIKQVSVI